jgi:hypothetical protein
LQPTTRSRAGGCKGTCTGTTTVTCSLGSLAVNQRLRVLITVKATAAGSLLNQVSVTANEHDPNLANNSFNQPLTVGPATPVPPVRLGTLGHCRRGCKQALAILTFFAPNSTTPPGSVDLMVGGTLRNGLVVPTTVIASQVKNGQTVGPLGVEPGSYTISQQGSVLANATSTILCSGETTPSSLPHTIMIAKRANVTCTITKHPPLRHGSNRRSREGFAHKANPSPGWRHRCLGWPAESLRPEASGEARGCRAKG